MYYMMAQGVTVNHKSLQAYTYNSTSEMLGIVGRA